MQPIFLRIRATASHLSAPLLLLLAVGFFVGAASYGATDPAAECAALGSLDLPDVTFDSLELVAKPAQHCKAVGKVGRNIRFALLLPTDWNGKFVMGGGGGFVGAIDNQAMMQQVLQRGFATVGTDTGHQAPGLDGSWAFNNYEAIVDYGHLAVHRVTEMAKSVIARHYQKDSETNYFFGCSNGGRQALQEAQRYPEDYDVIVSGAPALDFDGLGANFVHVTQKMYPDSSDLSKPILSKEDRVLLRAAIVNECDGNDGIKDKILNDPNACGFEPKSLLCKPGETTGCLTEPKIAAIEAVYDGAPGADGKPYYFGNPFGAEDVDANGWGSWLVGRENGGGPGVPNAAYGFGVGLMRYFIYQDKDWDYEDYDFTTLERDSAALDQVLSADSPDLDAFRERGGKLLMYHGWSDSALSANATTTYVDSVYERDLSAREDLRLFMMPGVLHCAGGLGPSMVDWVGAAEGWKTSGKAPEELVAGYIGKEGQRKLCAWPKKAVYKGGEENSPESFTCE